MDEVEPGPTNAAASASGDAASGAPATAGAAAAPAAPGAILAAARTAAGLSLEEVGARTRVPLRHLQAVETGDYAELPSPTYAVGFAKAYARAVGADEVAVAAAVRQDIGKLGRRQPEYTPYEIADPARVPSRGVAVVGLGIAVAVMILIGLWYGTNLFRNSRPTAEAAPAFTPVAAAPTPAPAPSPAAAGEQVTLTASDEVWVRVHDAADKTLFQGTLKAGDHYDVPAGADNPMIDVGRPDKLAVTLNGSAAPALGSGAVAVRNVPIGGAALMARASGAAVPAAALPSATGVPTAAGGPATTVAAPAPSPASVTPAARSVAASSTPARVPSRSSTATATRRERSAPRERPARTPARAARPRRHLTETQRANLQSAANPPPPAYNP